MLWAGVLEFAHAGEEQFQVQEEGDDLRAVQFAQRSVEHLVEGPARVHQIRLGIEVYRCDFLARQAVRIVPPVLAKVVVGEVLGRASVSVEILDLGERVPHIRQGYDQADQRHVLPPVKRGEVTAGARAVEPGSHGAQSGPLRARWEGS